MAEGVEEVGRRRSPIRTKEKEEMAEETKAAPVSAEATKKLKKKKSRPTNCVQSNKRIHRKDWYYRDGKYFANKQCYRLYVEQEAEKKEKEAVAKKEAAEKAAAEKAAAAAQPAAETNPSSE